MAGRFKESLRIFLVASALTMGNGCVPDRNIDPVSKEELNPSDRISTPSPTPLPIRTPTVEFEKYEKIELEKTTSIVKIAENYPQWDNSDPYYLWYLWNGGRKLFDPLAIPVGTVLSVPNPDQEPPFSLLLPEITDSPENWENKLAGYTTSLQGSSDNRMQNIQVATEKLNDTIVEPFKLFSMNETLGPFTKEEGYTKGWGYTPEGEVPMFAGGVCQLPSTLFKPAAEAGMLVISRHNHLYYDSRYGAWDATIDREHDLDFTFRNLYPYPVQVRSQINEEQEKLAVSIWSPSTSVYDRVEIKTLYDRENNDGTRESTVRQKVLFNERIRTRDYYSQYDPKPTPSP